MFCPRSSLEAEIVSTNVKAGVAAHRLNCTSCELHNTIKLDDGETLIRHCNFTADEMRDAHRVYMETVVNVVTDTSEEGGDAKEETGAKEASTSARGARS